MATRLSVSHRTTYHYRRPVRFDEHRAIIRPRDSHDLRVLSARLTLSPPGRVRWIHDVFSNSIALIDFDEPGERLQIESEVRLEHYGLDDPDWMLREYAQSYPFRYDNDQMVDLLPSLQSHYPDPEGAVRAWAVRFLDPAEFTPTQDLLRRITAAIREEFEYEARDEHGTQPPTDTLMKKKGTCRDYALFMIEAVRALGLAARFVTGYLYDPALDEGAAGDGESVTGAGATHAWVQVYLPGAGWVEYDPTNGIVGGTNLIRVAVARDPRQAIPLKGSFQGDADDFERMEVEVKVTRS